MEEAAEEGAVEEAAKERAAEEWAEVARRAFRERANAILVCTAALFLFVLLFAFF